MNSALVVFCVLIGCVLAVPCESPFGVAGNFRLFAINNIYGCSSDVQGAIAGGAGVSLTNYGIGETWTPATDYALLSAGPISFHSGMVNNGAVLGSSVSDISSVTIVNQGVSYISSECCGVEGCGACTTGASPVDFSVAGAQLQSLSDLWGSWPTTVGANIVEEYGNIQLTCYGDGVNVFSGIVITEDNNEININCAAGQTVVINYAASTTGIPSGFGTNLRGGVTASTVVHHFGRAHTNVFISATQGTVFAPFATLNFPNGLIVGDVIVNNFGSIGSCNGGQINYAPCEACPSTDGDVRYCCLYENESYHFAYTNAFCSTLPCNHIFFPHWDLVRQYTTPDCHQCCF